MLVSTLHILLFAKIVSDLKSFTFFAKILHLRRLTRFWTRLSIFWILQCFSKYLQKSSVNLNLVFDMLQLPYIWYKTGAQLEGEGVLPCPFSKIGKKWPNSRKNPLIVLIYGLIKVLSRLKNSSFSIVDFKQVNISWGMIIHEQTIQADTIIETTE